MVAECPDGFIAIAFLPEHGQHVVASGRNRAVLDLLADRFGARVSPVEFSGDEDADGAAMARATDGPIDLVLDFLPHRAPGSVARAGCAAGWCRLPRRLELGFAKSARISQWARGGMAAHRGRSTP
ncbi:hypothetical protein [Amycolatopsis sp. cmx-4-83]|uniref:hypothetical protein n=1 Tax=Amycolatopsis sp. cmx-4-83 TaxID=2790940 RepID=UPI00397A42A5